VALDEASESPLRLAVTWASRDALDADVSLLSEFSSTLGSAPRTNGDAGPPPPSSSGGEQPAAAWSPCRPPEGCAQQTSPLVRFA